MLWFRFLVVTFCLWFSHVLFVYLLYYCYSCAVFACGSTCCCITFIFICREIFLQSTRDIYVQVNDTILLSLVDECIHSTGTDLYCQHLIVTVSYVLSIFCLGSDSKFFKCVALSCSVTCCFSGLITAIVLCRENAISHWRAMMGNTKVYRFCSNISCIMYFVNIMLLLQVLAVVLHQGSHTTSRRKFLDFLPDFTCVGNTPWPPQMW